MYYNLPPGFGSKPEQPQQMMQQQPQMFGGANAQGNQPAAPQGSSQLQTALGIGSLQPQPMQKNPFGSTPVLGLPQRMADGGSVVPSDQKSAMVGEAISAVQGRHPEPRRAISAFEQVMGPDAVTDLIRQYAEGGRIRGPGGGVADLVPGSIDGREDVRLASGEYVIPARVVSALGDGDSDRGAQILDEFVARVRAKGADMMAGSDPIDPASLLPEV